MPLFIVGVDAAKEAIYARLRLKEPGPGYCHFPHDRDGEWFRQLTAERITTRFHRGRPIREWKKRDGDRNEALDCRVYARRRREYQAVKWIPQGWAWVDPQKEFNAVVMAIRAGLMSRDEAVATYGYDAEEIDREIAAANARADKLGLALDSDPRRRTRTGAAVQEEVLPPALNGEPS